MNTITKYILASSIVTILVITLFGLHTLNRYHDNEVLNEKYKLETYLRTFWQLASSKGTNFRVVDRKLLIDNYTVNGNFELPDRIQEIFGGVATIFMGDERVSTNVLNDKGQRALGTRLTGPAYDAVFIQERPYRGTTTILGIPYLTAYDPITDHTGKVIGALFVGVKESDFLARLHDMKTQLNLTLFSMVTALTFVMVLLAMALKRVEDSNVKQLNFQNTLMDTIPSPIFYKDADCRYLGCNQAFEVYAGFTRDQLLGKTPHELWPVELADRYRQQDLALLEHPGLQIYETAIRYADGSLRDVIFNKATFSGKDGTAAGLVGVILDITERKAAEEETKNAYQQLFDIVDFLPDATFVVNKEKKVIAWNRAIEKMTGLHKEDVIGKGDYVYSLPFYGERRQILIDLIDEDMDLIRKKYAYITIEGRTLFGETFIPNFRGGSDCHLWGTATPLFDKSGHQVGAIESIRDITEYRQAEQEKLRLQTQINQARMMENVVMRLGHDLKTPLTPLFIMLSLLKKRLIDPELLKMVDLCHKNATSINNLADKTRILATLSADVQPYEREAVPLAALVDLACADCGDIITHKQIECRNAVQPAVVVTGVPAQLNELFVNLISNAVHFSREHGAIVISAEQHDETLTISVQDEGVGLAHDHLDHIFDEFFKADESRHNIDAPGLGLSICKRIVRNHHGSIWAESPGLGQGTTIRFTVENPNSDRNA